MRHRSGKKSAPPQRARDQAPPATVGERARELLLRLETAAGNPVQTAEELDRMQGALERSGEREDMTERVRELCGAWSERALRGEHAQAWLVLVGGFDLKEHAERAAELAEDAALPPPLRERACRVLARLGGEGSVRALQCVLLSQAPPSLRAAAAEALAETGDRSVAPVLQSLLDEDLPRGVWNAVSEAADRLR